MLDAAVQGQGIALARSPLVENDLATGRLTRLFETSIPSEFAYYAICRREAARRAEVASFLDWLTASAQRA